MYWTAPDPSPQFALTRAIVTAIAVCLIGGLVLAARGAGGLPQRLSRFGTLAGAPAETAQRVCYHMAAAPRRPQGGAQSGAGGAPYFFLLPAGYPAFPLVNNHPDPP